MASKTVTVQFSCARRRAARRCPCRPRGGRCRRYRIIFEWRSGQTIGKRLTRVRVIETHPTTSAVPSAAKRNLAFFLPFLGFPVFELVETPFWYWLVPSVIVSAVIVWQIASRRDTYYDKAAGTQVIQVRRNLPWLAVPTPAA
jgi:uncharacterized RDD family membrane protein YckC